MTFDFDEYYRRYDEWYMQWLVEQVERVSGITPNLTITFEDRWNRVMNGAPVLSSGVPA